MSDLRDGARKTDTYETPAAPAPGRTVAVVVRSMRPRQWTKNLLLFAPVIFAGELGSPPRIAAAIGAFVVFCAASGAAYLLNDVVDAERDRAHGSKRSRPVASGELSASAALLAAAGLAALSLGGALVMGVPLAIVTGVYLALQLAYSLRLKRWAVIDVTVVAAGFVLRALAGAVAASVSFSPWLIACVALLALFLALAKRRHELLLLDEGAQGHRTSLGSYSPAWIDATLAALTAVTILAYSSYALLSAAARQHPYLVLTVPFVALGLGRYLYLIYRRDLGGTPDEILLTDVPLIACIAVWLAVSVTAILL